MFHLKKISSLLLIALFFSQPAFARPLSPQDVITLTLQNSPTGKSLGLAPQSAATQRLAGRSQYDLNLAASASHTEDRSKRASPVFGTETKSTITSFTASQLTPLGTTVTTTFRFDREFSNSAFAANPTLYDMRGIFQLTQPLLKNYFGVTTRQNILLANREADVIEADARTKLQDLMYQNLTLYWNWYTLQRLVSWNQQALLVAQKTLDTYREKKVRGLVEPVDVLAFEASLDQRQAELLSTKSDLVQTSEDLKVALGLSDKSITPLRGKNLYNPRPLSVIESEALKKNPVLSLFKADLAAQNIRVSISKNQKLPQLDLVSSLSLNGLDPRSAQAFQDLGNVHEVWSAGLNFSIPLQNRGAKARHQESLIEKKRKILALAQAENKILGFTKAGFERLSLARTRLTTAQRITKTLKEKWDGELTRYDQGRSSPDLVLRAQNDYLEAERFLLQSDVAARLAELDLMYVTGELLVP